MTSYEFNDEDRPKTPLEEDCCGNGCNPCIFDVHKKLLEEWKKKKSSPSCLSVKKNFLSPLSYNRFIIKDIAKASEDCIFMQLDCASENKDDILFLYPSQHVMINLVSKTKPYTPISWNSKTLKFLIKLYPNGETSNSIKQLKVNDELFLRGPYGEFTYKRNSFKNIIMLSIGSGIAAVYPLAVSIIKDELEETKINLLAGFSSVNHIPLKNELRLLSDFWNFQCTFYLSQKSFENITGLEIVNSRLDEEKLNEILQSHLHETSIVLICGTTEFNNTVEKIVIEKKFHYYVFR